MNKPECVCVCESELMHTTCGVYGKWVTCSIQGG